MSYNPIEEINDHALNITPEIIFELEKLKASEMFTELPGADIEEEKERLSSLMVSLLEILILNVQDNPSKLWVLKQFQPKLKQAEYEDTEAREHLGEHLAKIMDILAIESSDGVLAYYLG